MPSPKFFLRRSAVLSTALAFAINLPLTVTSAEAMTNPAAGINLGVVGDLARMQSATGQSFGLHRYGTFEGGVPSGRMITVRSKASWRTTASAKPGSTLYNNIARWADTIKSRRSKTFVAFHHEPELQSQSKYGTAADFIAAFRRVVTIFRKRGASNAVFTWQMTGWAFRTTKSDRQYAARWYPGDAYVDVVGADAYNWYTCGEGVGRWVSLKTLVDPVIAFAKAHGKQAALPEFGVERNSRRASWLNDAGQYLKAKDSVMAAAFYFQHPPTNPANSDCSWPLSTSAEFSAIRKWAASSTFAP